MGSCVEQFEATEEVDQARLKYLQMWTEKRLETVVITVPGKDRDLYRLLCEPRCYLIVFYCNTNMFSFPSLMKHS